MRKEEVEAKRDVVVTSFELADAEVVVERLELQLVEAKATLKLAAMNAKVARANLRDVIGTRR